MSTKYPMHNKHQYIFKRLAYEVITFSVFFFTVHTHYHTRLPLAYNTCTWNVANSTPAASVCRKMRFLLFSIKNCLNKPINHSFNQSFSSIMFTSFASIATFPSFIFFRVMSLLPHDGTSKLILYSLREELWSEVVPDGWTQTTHIKRTHKRAHPWGFRQWGTIDVTDKTKRTFAKDIRPCSMRLIRAKLSRRLSKQSIRTSNLYFHGYWGTSQVVPFWPTPQMKPNWKLQTKFLKSRTFLSALSRRPSSLFKYFQHHLFSVTGLFWYLLGCLLD